MEQVTRIELASPAWKAGALTIVLHLHMPSLEISAELEYHEMRQLSSIPAQSFEIFCEIGGPAGTAGGQYWLTAPVAQFT